MQLASDQTSALAICVASNLEDALVSLRLACQAAGVQLVAQLTDADRAQADEAGRRA